MDDLETEAEPETSGHMSFLDHLDELRRRVISSVIIIVIAFALCWFVSDHIYNFLSIPIRQALSDAARRDLPIGGITGQEKLLPLSEIKESNSGRYIFDRSTKLGTTVVSPGASVMSQVSRDADGKLGLFTTEQLITFLSLAG